MKLKFGDTIARSDGRGGLWYTIVLCHRPAKISYFVVAQMHYRQAHPGWGDDDGTPASWSYRIVKTQAKKLKYQIPDKKFTLEQLLTHSELPFRELGLRWHSGEIQAGITEQRYEFAND